MINWIVSFETFAMEATKVSRLRKNWIICFQPIKFEKISDQPIIAKQASAYAGWRDMTRQSHGAVESIFRKRQSFLKNCQISLGISATLTRITKGVEGCLCFKKKN